MAKEYKDLVVGLDIGTAKVMVVVAEVLASYNLDPAEELAKVLVERVPVLDPQGNPVLDKDGTFAVSFSDAQYKQIFNL